MNCTGPCPAERIIEQLDRRLSIFNLSLSDIGVFVTDMGSDVQKVARVANKFTFPCLCHVVNLIVKDFMLKTGADIPDDDELEFEADGADPEEAEITDVVIRVKREVRRVRHRIDMETRLTKAQEVKNGKGFALKLIQDNATRWNSTLDMLERFLNLRDFIAIAVDGIDNFNWDALTELVDLLSPLVIISTCLRKWPMLPLKRLVNRITISISLKRWRTSFLQQSILRDYFHGVESRKIIYETECLPRTIRAMCSYIKTNHSIVLFESNLFAIELFSIEFVFPVKYGTN